MLFWLTTVELEAVICVRQQQRNATTQSVYEPIFNIFLFYGFLNASIVLSGLVMSIYLGLSYCAFRWILVCLVRGQLWTWLLLQIEADNVLQSRNKTRVDKTGDAGGTILWLTDWCRSLICF